MSSEINAVSTLPFCLETKGKQTGISKGLRLTAAAMGVILAIIGGLGLLNTFGLVQNFVQISPALGWSLTSVGTLLLLVASTVKCVINNRISST